MTGLARILTPFFLMFVLAACGGGDAETPWDQGTTTGDTATATYTLGNGAGGDFQSGDLRIAVTSLSAGGSTSVIVTVADSEGNLYTEDLDIIFSSRCVVNGLAVIESPVTATNGMATTTYEAQGCTGSDEISAYATIEGVTVSATGTVNVAAANLGSMQFVSADPANIGLKGFGLIESSDVTFRVLDTNSNPVSGQRVNFSLNTTVGGISLINSSATSDVNGLVRATITSGTIPTSVRITATLASNSSISTQSDGVTVSTGISDQNSFSLALSNHAPEAWSRDGQTVTATVHAADHFNNPVPDGTAIYFTTEGGQIGPQCLTVDGECTVEWRSSNPRTIDGRVTILATMLGEESFIDSVPSNGYMDDGETFFDLGEAYRDDDESGSYTPYVDEYVDYNSDGQYTNADGLYNGILCSTGSTCSSEKNIHVRDTQILVMARTNLTFDTDAPDPIVSTNQEQMSYTVCIYGVHNDASHQWPPTGTKLTFDASIGEITSIKEATVPDYGGALGDMEAEFCWGFSWKGGEESEFGMLHIIAETPAGLNNILSISLESVNTGI
ncbi:MAG: Ig-like domain-containing protein [Candidatus Thiodiazotropha sp.]